MIRVCPATPAVLVLAVIALATGTARAAESHQATGVKVGELTPTSAIIWMRLTRTAARNQEGLKPGTPEGDAVTSDTPTERLHGACPGMPGRVRVRYGERADMSDARTTPWATVNEQHDFAHQFRLDDLRPATEYHYRAESQPLSDSQAQDPGHQHAPLNGRFRTPATPDQRVPVTFTVVTGQAIRDLDHPDGFNIYPAMLKLRPDFHVLTGDTVYYDNDPPNALTIAGARFHWQRMYGLPRLVNFHLQIPAYWEKDDHDAWLNDCWPGGAFRSLLPVGLKFTFEEGLEIFREQVPMSEKTYRTFRWGKGLQIWLTEGRDFRSPNTDRDSPEKTIWGAEQLAWLRRTLLESDADCKILISPTPIVGPDRLSKTDNHANRSFAHEGDAFRAFIAENMPDNFFVVCGDRHWQYVSTHPVSGLREYSCGPASDQHSGGTPGFDPAYHLFHRVGGGFLSVHYEPPAEETAAVVNFRLHDVDGNLVYRHDVPLKPAGITANPLPRAELSPGRHGPYTMKAVVHEQVILPYLVHLPQGYDTQADKAWPLILFLHGAGERGTDTTKIASLGPMGYAQAHDDFPFVVAAPQCPLMADWSPNTLVALLDELATRYRIDPDRIYLTGFSMGGSGTWETAIDHPERFAAIAPLCGRLIPLLGFRIWQTPVWCFHGDADEAVPVSNSREMTRHLKNMGNPDVTYTEFPGAGHGIWNQVYGDPKLYEWFLQHKRK